MSFNIGHWVLELPRFLFGVIKRAQITPVAIYGSNSTAVVWLQNFSSIILGPFLFSPHFCSGSTLGNNTAHSSPRCTVKVLLVSTTRAVLRRAAWDVPSMPKCFRRDCPIFWHDMILIFSQAIPQSMHRERLKLWSTLYRQLPKLAFNGAILAWIWVV